MKFENGLNKLSINAENNSSIQLINVEFFKMPFQIKNEIIEIVNKVGRNQKKIITFLPGNNSISKYELKEKSTGRNENSLNKTLGRKTMELIIQYGNINLFNLFIKYDLNSGIEPDICCVFFIIEFKNK
jgi:hypothetical protein